MNSTLQTLLQRVHIPADFARYENITEEGIIASLDEWKCNAHHTLVEIRTLLEDASNELSLQEQANVVSAVAAFGGSGTWITPASRTNSRGTNIRSAPSMGPLTEEADILHEFSEPQDTLLTQILTYNVKPLFLSNPHPSLNIQSGRKLPRPAGGPMASQDFFEGQKWKTEPGTSNLISWCVRNMRVRSLALHIVCHLDVTTSATRTKPRGISLFLL